MTTRFDSARRNAFALMAITAITCAACSPDRVSAPDAPV
jgi:hypothetical protein